MIVLICFANYNIEKSYKLKFVYPKHEMKSVWTDRAEDDVGPKRKMKSIWADKKQE